MKKYDMTPEQVAAYVQGEMGLEGQALTPEQLAILIDDERKRREQIVRISLDDGETWQDVTSLRIVREVEVPGEDNPAGELHFNLTPEGVITDVWCSRWSDLDHNIATSSETYNELVLRMVEQSSGHP